MNCMQVERAVGMLRRDLEELAIWVQEGSEQGSEKQRAYARGEAAAYRNVISSLDDYFTR